AIVAAVGGDGGHNGVVGGQGMGFGHGELLSFQKRSIGLCGLNHMSLCSFSPQVNESRLRFLYTGETGIAKKKSCTRASF
ncbi:hypothetical protein QP933_10815, partial [Corynebacterium pseudodiphtheriticum]|uniref:hypothetical protein n=1 Tax=Corynebacterium pseudodiphtheriticum TaxID=37637 RepID=UPI00254E1BA1